MKDDLVVPIHLNLIRINRLTLGIRGGIRCIRDDFRSVRLGLFGDSTDID